jgi:hypothetical protein
MPASPVFLVDEILPAGEPHLIGGASGSGKTTWIFKNFLADWQAGKPVFGHESHPVPYVYISLDRKRSSVTRTLERLGLVGEIVRIVCLDEMPETCLTLTDVVTYALAKFPDSQLILIEGFALLSGERTNGYTAVGKLMRRASRLCAEKKVTIVGVCHAPKMKADEQFQHSRELLLGSVSWAAYSDTIIILNLDEESGDVTIKVMPRNAAMESHLMRFGVGGVLEPAVIGSKCDYLYYRIGNLSAGRPITRGEVLQWAKAHKISDRTADSAIKKSSDAGILDSIGDGVYERTTLTTPPLAPDSDLSVEL